MPDRTPQNRREDRRVPASLPIELKLDAQVTVQGKLKDISPNSAFVQMRESVYMRLNDELKFFIRRVGADLTQGIAGTGRISRIVQGEGIALYFTELDKDSSAQLNELLK